MGLMNAIGSGLGKVGTGLGRFSEFLYPVDPNMAAGIDPGQLAQLRRAAMLRTGLGMMTASNNGEGLGGALLAGLQVGGGPLDEYVRTAYTNRQRQRSEDKADARYTEERNYRLERDRLADERAAAAAKRQADQDAAEQRWRETLARLQEKGLGIKAVGASEDAARAERIRQQDAEVNAILKKAQAEKRALTRDEMLTIQAIRGNSLGSALGGDLLSTLMMGGGLMGGGLQVPGMGTGAAPTKDDVWNAFNQPPAALAR